MNQNVIAAYMYPGWHAVPERDNNMYPGFSEWDLVLKAAPRFDGHNQPRIPLKGPYDDSLPETAETQITLARRFGVNVFVYGFFWSRGKRVFNAPLDRGFLKSTSGGEFPFALMWANRMPRGVLPVKESSEQVIDPKRLVYTDPDDFVRLIAFAAENYFTKKNYFRINGRPLFSIFDSTFFLRQLGVEKAAEAVKAARDEVREMGLPGLHLMALNPAPAFCADYSRAGFDSASHYVWLPDWKGDYTQDYAGLAKKRSKEWPGFQKSLKLPYFPSVSPGWDATPRGEIHGNEKPRRYPWWPVVTGEHPDRFHEFLSEAVCFSRKKSLAPITFIASWNEWSEGHYLEPDRRFGTGWLEAVKAVADE